MKIYVVKTPHGLEFFTAQDLRMYDGPGKVIEVREVPEHEVREVPSREGL